MALVSINLKCYTFWHSGDIMNSRLPIIFAQAVIWTDRAMIIGSMYELYSLCILYRLYRLYSVYRLYSLYWLMNKNRITICEAFLHLGHRLLLCEYFENLRGEFIKNLQKNVFKRQKYTYVIKKQ